VTSCYYLHAGQRTCHADDGREVQCEGSGQDASFFIGTPWPELRFDLCGDEVVDRLTGLTWFRNAKPSKFLPNWHK
jgi:hypothetical protein